MHFRRGLGDAFQTLPYSIHLVEHLLNLRQTNPPGFRLLYHQIYQFYQLITVAYLGHAKQILALLRVVETQDLPVIEALEGLICAGREQSDPQGKNVTGAGVVLG